MLIDKQSQIWRVASERKGEREACYELHKVDEDEVRLANIV
jgi:hypothetical protein